MVGLCGVLGEREYGIDRMATDLRWTGGEVAASYADERVAVENVHHPRPEYEQPATTGTDTLVWAQGDVGGSTVPRAIAHAKRAMRERRRSSARDGTTITEFRSPTG